MPKQRRVCVMLELDTELPLTELRSKTAWEEWTLRLYWGDVVIHQVQANVIQKKPKAKPRKKK